MRGTAQHRLAGYLIFDSYNLSQLTITIVITSHFHQHYNLLQKSQQIAKQVRKAGRFSEQFYFVRNLPLKLETKLTNSALQNHSERLRVDVLPKVSLGQSRGRTWKVLELRWQIRDKKENC